MITNLEQHIYIHDSTISNVYHNQGSSTSNVYHIHNFTVYHIHGSNNSNIYHIYDSTTSNVYHIHGSTTSYVYHIHGSTTPNVYPFAFSRNECFIISSNKTVQHCWTKGKDGKTIDKGLNSNHTNLPSIRLRRTA